MSIIAIKKTARPETSPQPVACRLCHKQLMRQGAVVKNMGEFELENVSSVPVDISYEMTRLQYLNLIVTNENGDVLSEGHFGDRFAPTAEPNVWRLEPREKFTANVHLFATVPSYPDIPKGTYLVQAVYEHDGLRCISEPLSVVIGD